MRFPSFSNRWVYVAFLIYAAAVALGAMILHYKDRSMIMETIDQELMVGAASVRYILADDFHDRALDADSISLEEDWRNIDALTRFVQRVRFAFLYTMIESDGEIYVTSSSASEDELRAGSQVHYFAPYSEARPYFKEDEVLFTTYTDRWGTFRAALIPEQSPGGRRYIAVAEFDIGHVEAQLRRKLVDVVVFSLVLLLAAIPLFIALDKELVIANVKLERRIEARTRELRRMATVDDLTGQLNRKELNRQLEIAVERSERSGLGCSLAVLDLDLFKSINDTWGHPMGDVALTQTATIIASMLRSTDTLGRIGGEEFAVILPETSRVDALTTAERIRRRVENARLTLADGKTAALTVSIGVASIDEAKGSLETLMKLADQRLYQAKERGRNRVV